MDYERRKAAFRAEARGEGLDGCYLPRKANIRYLCGFTGDDSALLMAADGVFLVTDSRYAEQAEQEARVDEVVTRKGEMAEAVGNLCRKLGLKRIGATSANVTHADFTGLGDHAPGTEVVACAEGIAERMRLCKDDREVAAVRAAVGLAEGVFSGFLEQVRPGRTEKWLAARLEFDLRAAGADGAAFETICAVDGNASKPHARPSDAAVTADCAVLLDWGARLNGYCSDLTRVACIGTIPARLSELAEVVLAAQQAAFEKLGPGVPCCEVDAAARAVIAEAGYGEFFGHGLGHGVGLEVHEEPRLSPTAQRDLQAGMIVTVEPGIYLPGEVGVRIEEMVLITADGHEVLSSLPRRPEDLLRAGG